MRRLSFLAPENINGAGDIQASSLLGLLTPAYLRRMSPIGLMAVRDRLNSVLPQEALPTTAPDTTNSDIAKVLSPSQLEKWRDCQAAWYYRYIVGLEETINGDRAQGKAVHKTAETYFRNYVETRTRLDLDASIDLYREALRAEFEGPVVLEDGDTKDSLEAEGIGLVAKYITEVAHTVEPAQLELPVEGKIGGVHVRGRLDILDVEGKVIDVKTASKSPSSNGNIRTGQLIQLATYSMLVPGCHGEAQIAHIVKNKTPKIVLQNITVNEAHRKLASKLYPLAQEGMRSGLYYPNRESFFCSRTKCSFWGACEKEYGGEVPA